MSLSTDLLDEITSEMKFRPDTLRVISEGSLRVPLGGTLGPNDTLIIVAGTNSPADEDPIQAIAYLAKDGLVNNEFITDEITSRGLQRNLVTVVFGRLGSDRKNYAMIESLLHRLGIKDPDKSQLFDLQLAEDGSADFVFIRNTVFVGDSLENSALIDWRVKKDMGWESEA